VVTGASSGIGLVTARMAARQDAHLERFTLAWRIPTRSASKGPLLVLRVGMQGHCEPL
jgi:hypothetical protein